MTKVYLSCRTDVQFVVSSSGENQENDASSDTFGPLPVPKQSTTTTSTKSAPKYVKKQKSGLNKAVENKDKKLQQDKNRRDKKEASQSTDIRIDEEPTKKDSSSSAPVPSPVLNKSAIKASTERHSSKSGRNESRNMSHTKKKGKDKNSASRNSSTIAAMGKKSKPKDSHAKKTSHGRSNDSRTCSGEQVYVRKDNK